MAKPRARLSRDDWTAAALAALSEGGTAAVAIEQLATRLGATKGSAYWHFPNREALLRATLARWEAEYTEAVIDLLEAEADLAVRLRRLLASVLEHRQGSAIELALLASADDPLVRAALRRVSERRINYLAEQFRELGVAPAQARHWAVLSYSAYLGHAQLARTAAGSVPSGPRAAREYLDVAMQALLAGTDRHHAEPAADA